MVKSSLSVSMETQGTDLGHCNFSLKHKDMHEFSNWLLICIPAMVLRYMRYSKLVISLFSHFAVIDDFLNSC